MVAIILNGVELIHIIRIYRQVISGVSLSEHPRNLIILLVLQLLPIIFLTMRLDTIVKNEGVYVRFFSFHRFYRFFPWESIEKLCVREYSPIAEYGGWGIRRGIGSGRKAYNVAGISGLQLLFDNGSELLIGTQKPDELAQVLQEMGHLQNQPA